MDDSQAEQFSDDAGSNFSIVSTALSAVTGIVMGLLAEYLDGAVASGLPSWIKTMDLHSFSSRFGIWLCVALCLCLASRCARQAALNSFVFVGGLCGAYYVLSLLQKVVIPLPIQLAWIGLLLLSPVLGLLFWNTQSSRIGGLFFSSAAIALLFLQALSFGWLYFSVTHWLELVLALCAAVLLRQTKLRTLLIIVFGILYAGLLQLLPFYSMFTHFTSSVA